MNHNYKLATIDLDDTLLDSKKEIKPYTSGVIRRLLKNGLIIILATGRNFRGSKRYYDELKLSYPMINCSGAAVSDNKHNRLLRPMNHSDVRDVIVYAMENNLHVQIETTDKYYFLKHSKYSDNYAFFYGYRGIEVPGIDEMEKITALKVLIISEPSTLENIKPVAKKKFHNLQVLHSLPSLLEFNNPMLQKEQLLSF